MMFNAPKLTSAGKALYYSNMGGAQIKFSTIQMGSGTMTGPISAMTALVAPVVTMAAIVKISDGYVDVSGRFVNAELAAGFYWREIGVFAENPDDPQNRAADILYCYQNAYDTADFIPMASAETVEKNITVPVIVGDATAVFCAISKSLIYASVKDLEDHNTDNTAHSDALNAINEKIKKHVENTKNPHTVTAKQIGAIPESQKGVAGGVATLGGDGKVQQRQLPKTIQIGPAATVVDLEPGCLLFITDGGIAADHVVSLEMLLDEGENAANGQEDRLGELLTPGVSAALNLRRDVTGAQYTTDTIGALATAIRALCQAAIDDGHYVEDETGRITLSWRQVQFYLLNGRLVSHEEADHENWLWAVTPGADHAAIAARVSDIEAILGDINVTLEQVNEGG